MNAFQRFAALFLRVRTTNPPPTEKDCAHDWLNWTDPELVTGQKLAVMGAATSGDPTQVELYQQVRKCTKCNLQQRAFS